MMKRALLFGLMAAAGATSSDQLSVLQEGKPVIEAQRDEFSANIPGLPLADEDKFKAFQEKMNSLAYREPQDAKIGPGERIIPEKPGSKLDQDLFAKRFYTYYYSAGSGHIDLPLLPIYPKVDSELLLSVKARQIGQYVTYFNSRNKARTQNIRLAAGSIDSIVVFPGEVFSFNQTVGKRTAAKGYLPAPVIVKGELSEGIGGGICQVSSTLYNAVDNAGTSIIQRYSHSKRVPYVPSGRDATVSWYGPDFTFRNTYNQPILIRAQVYGGTLAIRVFSSDAIQYEPRNVPGAAKFGEQDEKTAD
jgi:vancomycin resistance protein YoaR